MVRLILVPVSPSGTGKTLSSLMRCFSRLMEAAPWMIIPARVPPSRVCLIQFDPFSRPVSIQPITMESMHTSTALTVTPVVLLTI
jgi:hypothetical protein